MMEDKKYKLSLYSNFDIAQKKTREYLGRNTELFISPRKDKKYRVYDPFNDKWIDFGQMEYEDFTKHKDNDRRLRYLKRATNIKGNWKNNPYIPNNLSLHVLWNY